MGVFPELVTALFRQHLFRQSLLSVPSSYINLQFLFRGAPPEIIKKQKKQRDILFFPFLHDQGVD